MTHSAAGRQQKIVASQQGAAGSGANNEGKVGEDEADASAAAAPPPAAAGAAAAAATYQSPGFWSEVEAAGRRPAKRPLEEETAVEGASGEQRRSRLAGFGAFLLDTARSLRRGGGWGR